MDIIETINLYNRGKDVWNHWALERKKEREHLEKTGIWLVESQDSNGAILSGSKETMEWVNSCSVSFVHNEFVSEVDFTGFIFPWKVDFSGAIFHHNANFSGCEFHSEFLIVATKFKRACYFRQAKFNNAFISERTIFEGMLWLDNALFQGYNHIYDVHFHNDVEAHGAKFTKGINIQYCIFHKDCNFTKAQIEWQGFFTKCEFKGASHWDDAIFFGEANWSGSKFSGYVSLNGTKFEQIPVFIQTDFIQAPSLEKIDIKSTKSDHYSEIVCWRSLRQIALKGLDSEREKYFFAMEIKAVRKEKGIFNSYSILAYIYGCLSDFGISFGRPIIWLLFSLVIFAGIYLAPNITYEEFANKSFFTKCSYGEGSKVTSAITISVQNAFPVGGFSNSELIKTKEECLFGINKSGKENKKDTVPNITNVFYILAKCQTIITGILIFLIGLAIRNRFRIS